MLQIDVNEADSRLFKDADDRLVRLLAMADSVALEATMDSTAGELVVNFFGRCEWSPTVVRPRQRRTVVSLTPSSVASSASGFLLRWM